MTLGFNRYTSFYLIQIRRVHLVDSTRRLLVIPSTSSDSTAIHVMQHAIREGCYETSCSLLLLVLQLTRGRVDSALDKNTPSIERGRLSVPIGGALTDWYTLKRGNRLLRKRSNLLIRMSLAHHDLFRGELLLVLLRMLAFIV